MQRDLGFTLGELMVTLALAAIVAVLAVPAFVDVIRSTRIAVQANDILGALAYARSEAVTHGVRVTLCKSADGRQCAAGGGYEQGWVIFVDEDDNARIGENETRLRVRDGLGGGRLTLEGNRPVADYVSYLPNGATGLRGGGFQAGTLTLCDPPLARRIVINRMGRARVEDDSC